MHITKLRSILSDHHRRREQSAANGETIARERARTIQINSIMKFRTTGNCINELDFQHEL